MTRPTVVISLDLEFSWGSFDLSYSDELLKMGRWTHDIGAPNLLKHLTRNGLSATWAIVGAMMRRSLPDVSGMPEVRYPHFPKPWFSYIPKDGDEQTHPEWFGASLVEMIRNATPEQEIGFHSFSHVPFGERGMTRERAIAEYRYCAQIAQELKIPKSSFVFPRNSVAVFEWHAQLPRNDLGGFLWKLALHGRTFAQRRNCFYSRFAPDPLRGRVAQVYSGFQPVATIEKRAGARPPEPWSFPRVVPSGKSLCRVAATGKRCGSFFGRAWRSGAEW